MFTISHQAETDADESISFGFGTLGCEWTFKAICALIISPVSKIIILSFIASGIYKIESLIGRTDKSIFLSIITKLLSSKLVFANEFWFSIMVGILIESVVLLHA